MNNLKRFQLFLWYLLPIFGMLFLSGTSFSAEKSLYNDHGRRDPFVPLVTTTMKTSSSNILGIDNIDDLVIEGLIYDPKHGSAVIMNGAVLKEGEELGNVKVTKIMENGAQFTVNGVEGFKEIYQEESGDRKNAKKT